MEAISIYYEIITYNGTYDNNNLIICQDNVCNVSAQGVVHKTRHSSDKYF